jgi:hypothetical protein
MTKWKNYIYIIAFAALSTTFGCTKDFAEINTNTNAPKSVQPSLRQVIYNLGENMSYEGFVAGDLLSQHTEPRWTLIYLIVTL